MKLAHVAIVLSIVATDGFIVLGVTKIVTSFRTLAARREPVERGYTLRPVAAVFSLTGVLYIWRVNIASM